MDKITDQKEASMKHCMNCKLTEAYRGQWRSTSLRLLDINKDLEQDRDRWKRLFIDMYAQNAGVTDEMMWAYRNETGKA